MNGQRRGSQIKEHIWLVALYEHEDRADELLERLSALGIDTSEATTVRVEIDDQMRAARYSPVTNTSPLSLVSRSAVTGGLLGGAAFLAIGIAAYTSGLLVVEALEGLFNHSILFVIIGAALGAMVGAILGSAKQHKSVKVQLPIIRQPRSEGFLVAVKMPPPFAEQAEEIARGLGAKEILL